MSGWALAFRMARREMRGGLRGFRIFLACLALGVAAIAAIGSLSSGVKDSLQRDARMLLGGDVEARVIHRPASAAPLEWLRRQGTVATVIELRAMAYRADGKRPDGARDRLLIELKAVDGAYPLYGEVETRKGNLGPDGVRARLAPSGGKPNVLVDPMVLARMGLEVGDDLKIGDATVRIGGVIEREPDRSTGLFTLGPRVLASEAALKATGLLRPGSLVYYRYRVKLPPGSDALGFVRRINAAFPDEGWRVRALTQAAPGMNRFIDQMTLYLTLVGLTALLVGGMGIANGVRAYLDGRTATIATFKCVGAPAALVFRIYLIQVMALAAIGVAAGLVLGALLPIGLIGLLEDVLPVRVSLGLYPLPLLLAATFGFLTALAFSLWAVARAREVPPATLFRQAIAPSGGRPRAIYIVLTGLLFAILAGLAIGTAVDKMMAAIFVGAAAVTFIVFRGVAWLIEWLAGRLSAPGGRPLGRPGLRLALANLHRPGAPTTSVVLSLGLGVTVLVAIALIQGNLSNQVARQLPAKAPSFFFIDIQPDQVKAFDAAVRSIAGAHGLQRSPMVRARIAKLNGVPVRQAKVAKEVRWATRNERGLTYSATPPENARIVEGRWWPANYEGPAIISFDKRLADGMGLKLGDTITFNILGRDITAKIANLREIRWRTLSVNFTVIFAPGTLEAAPHSHIAAVHVPPDKELALVRAVTDKLPNVSAIRVRDALDTAATVLGNIGFAVRITAGVTLAAGLLVLAGAVAAGHGRRVYDAVVLKVVGATRGRVLRTFLLEHGLLGLATSVIAALLGTLTAYLVLTLAMRAEWEFLPGVTILTALICTVVTIVFGFIGTWRAMGQKPAPLLRNE